MGGYNRNIVFVSGEMDGPITGGAAAVYGIMAYNKYCYNVIFEGRGLSKEFIPLRCTHQPSWILNKFESEEMWGLDSHRDDPLSGENKEVAQL